jgi:ankyrin repeat protein
VGISINVVRLNLLVILIAVMSLMLMGCQNAEDARRELGKISITFDEANFIKVVEEGDLEAAKLFVTAGMHPNVISKDRSPLLVAVEEENIEMIKFLTNEDANVNIKAKYTPLYMAIHKNNYDIVKLLLEEGADPNILTSSYPLDKALENSNIEIIKALITSGANKSLRDPIKSAAENTNYEVVQLLLALGFKVKEDALLGTKISDHQVMRALVNAGANLNARDSKGNTPLMLASLYGWENTVSLLIKSGADVNTQRDGNTALSSFEVNSLNVNIIKALLAAGAMPTKEDLEYIYYFYPSMREVIEQGNSILSTQRQTDLSNDTELNKRLMEAVDKRDINQVKELLEAGADPNFIDASSLSVLMNAAYRGNTDIARILLKYGADVNLANKYGGNVLFAPIYKSEMLKLLLDAGANPNVVAIDTDKGESMSPLAGYAIQGNVEITKMLLDAGADPNIQVMEGYSPLIFASANNNLEVVEVLLQYGADKNLTTNMVRLL